MKEHLNNFFNFLVKHDNKLYILLMVLGLIPLIIIAFYAHPVFDDFAYSIDTRKAILNGEGFMVIWAAIMTSIQFMYTWQGLYTSAFLLALQPSIFGEKFYFITIFVILGILFLGIYLFYKAIRRNILPFSKTKTWLLTFVTLFFLVETVPTPYEALYWFNGAVNYIFFFGIFLIIIAMYINCIFQEKVNWLYVLLLTILTFALSGGNHVTAFAGLFIEFIFVIYAFVKRKKRYLSVPFIFGFIGFVINLLAPGTRIRADMLDFNGDAFLTLKTTFEKSFGFFSNWVSVSLILFIILVLILLYNDLKNKKVSYNNKMWLFPILSYLLLAGMLCVPHYALGTYGAGRVTDTVYFAFVMVILFNMVFLFKYLIDIKVLNLKKFENINKKIKFLIIVLIIVFIGFFGNNVYYNSTTYEAVRELITHEAQNFSAENDKRVEKYLNPNVNKVIVNEFEEKPILLYGGDVCEITEDNKCENEKINYYYNKKVIGFIKHN